MLLAAGLLGPTKVAAAPALSTVHAIQVTAASPSARGSPHLASRLGLKTSFGQQDKSKCDKGRDLIPLGLLRPQAKLGLAYQPWACDAAQPQMRPHRADQVPADHRGWTDLRQGRQSSPS